MYRTSLHRRSKPNLDVLYERIEWIGIEMYSTVQYILTSSMLGLLTVQ